MITKDYLEILSNDSLNPCFFVNIETNIIAYVNQTFIKNFQIWDDYVGRSCEELLAKTEIPESFCNHADLTKGVFSEDRMYSDILQTHLRLKSTLITVNESTLLMIKFYLTDTNEQRSNAQHTFEVAMEQCLDLLTITNRTTAIESFLELLANYYACDTAFIDQFNRETNRLEGHYLWSSIEHNLNSLDQEDTSAIGEFLEWLENDHAHEIISIDSTTADVEPDSMEDHLFKKYSNMHNITISKLWNHDGSLMGIVGISNRTKPFYDDRLLRAVSLFVMEKFDDNTLVRALESLHEVDLLTGFYTRNKYNKKLLELDAAPPKELAILFINLNGLRKTNEYFGYEAGDEHIHKTAVTLREYFGSVFFRLSGDEFVGFVPNCEKTIFEKKIESLRDKLKLSHDENAFSLGHAWATGRYNIANLIQVANTVMLINKQAFYSQAATEDTKVSSSILSDLLKGLHDDEFLVYLQPQINLQTGKLIGAEALIRRFDKTHNKMIFPDSFIPLYEQNAIIRHVDLYVVAKVCALLQEWTKIGKHVPISVNLSRVTLMEHGIVKTIAQILDDYKISHDLIIIEVTERIGLIENEVASSVVDEFKEYGFKLSLDDFGCAYSNIITLAQIFVDEVKIDKSLVDHLLDNERNRIIVDSIIAMCNRFRSTRTLAEGIETQEQSDILRDFGCNYGQGYLYSKPITTEEFTEKYITSME